MREMLKVKAKALAAEARATRLEEVKARDRLRLETCAYDVYVRHNGGRRRFVVPDGNEMELMRRWERNRARLAVSFTLTPEFKKAHARHLDRLVRARAGFHHHRTAIVRAEARLVALARAFLAGRPYREVESAGTRSRPVFEKVLKLALSHGFYDGKPWGSGELAQFKDRFRQWRLEADKFLLAQGRIDRRAFPLDAQRLHNQPVVGDYVLPSEVAVHG